jgi:hypothetical protein
MYKVCKVGGVVVILSVENEGEREKYHGLHQWNLRADDSGLWLSDRKSKENLLDLVPGAAYTWSYQDHGPTAYKVFRAIVKK